MSRLIEIPLNKTQLMTQPDPEDIPLGACVEIEDYELDQSGKIYKRNNDTQVNTIGSREFTQIMKWVNENFTGGAFDGTAWITFDATNDTIEYWSANWNDAPTTIKDLVSGVSDIKILNFHDKLRFANGLTKSPGVFQYIDRNYFWNSAIKTVGAFDYDDCAPDDDDQSYTLAITDETGSGGSLEDAKTYYYKFVPIFDGNQEAPMPKRYISNSPGADSSTNIITAVYSGVNTSWNERLTGYNIYRAEAWNGPYYRILSISTLDNNDSNLEYHTGALVGYGLYVPDKSWSSHAGDDVLIKSIIYEISSNTTDVATLATQIVDGYEIWGGEWAIITANVFVANCQSTFEVVNVADWTLTNCSMAIALGDPYQGNRAGEITMDAAADQSSAESPTFAVSASTNYYISVAVKKDANVDNVKVYAKDDVGGYAPIGTSTSGTYEVITGTVLTDGAATTLQIKIEVNDAGANQEIGYVDNLYVGVREDFGTTDGYAGINTVIDDDFVLDAEDGRQHYRVLVGTNTNGNNDASAEIRRVTNNVGKALLVDSDFTGSYIGSNQTVYLSKNYLWQLSDTNEVTLTIYDTGIINGRTHPYGDAIIEVNYEFGQYIDGRLYVLSTRLDPNGTAEDHKNFLLFSELNQPDVIPITNYIEIRDLQGETPKGLADQLGDLVIFMERGIQKLRIPANDPTTWSRVEIAQDIGCIASNSIISVAGTIFFAGEDYIYAVPQDFRPVPITENLKDTYQDQSNLNNSRTIYDPLKRRVICRFGDDDDNMYLFDYDSFSKTGELKWNMFTVATDTFDLLSINEDLQIYYYNNHAASGNVAVYTLATATTGNKTTKYKSGWIPIADLDRSNIIRRLNMRYLSADIITAKIFADGDDSSEIRSMSFPVNTGGSDLRYYSHRPSRRAKYIMIQLTTSGTSNYNTTVERIEVELDD